MEDCGTDGSAGMVVGGPDAGNPARARTHPIDRRHPTPPDPRDVTGDTMTQRSRRTSRPAPPTPLRIVRALALPIGLGLLAACAGGEPGDAGTATGLDSPDRTLALATTPVYMIGGLDAPEWATFGELAAVRFDDAGNLYVLDRQARVISVVSPEGELVRTVGSPGEGPGELGGPLSMLVTPGGGVAVFDFTHQGLVVYDSTGAYVRNVRMDVQEVGVPGGDLSLAESGDVIAPIRGMMRFGPDAPADTLPPGRPVARIPLDGDGEPGVIYRAWDLEAAPMGDENLGGTGIRIRIPRERAFGPPLFVLALPDRLIAVADSFGYRIKLVDTGGVVRGTLERPVEPTVVTDAIREAERGRRLDELEEGNAPGFVISTRGGGSSQVDPEAAKRFQQDRIGEMLFAEAVPVIEAMALDREGRIWVQRSSGMPGQPGPTDVITPDGRYLGTFPPDGLRIPDAFGPDGLLARIETDEYDVPTVVVERLPDGWR